MIEGLSRLSSAELVAAVPEARRRERESMACMLAHLAVVDARLLYADLGFSSMFAYLTRGLGYSEEAALRRLKVARLMTRFPQVHGALADGRLHLTAASLLAPTMSEDNADALIAAAAGKTRRAVEALLADRAPKPDAPTRVRKLPSPKPLVTPERSLFDPRETYPSQAGRARPERARTARTAPLGRDRYNVSFTASAALMGKLERLGALLSHTTIFSMRPRR